MNFSAMTSYRPLWRSLLVAVVWGGLFPATVLAHGGGTPQLTDIPAGPYHLFVWTSPEPWQAGAAAHITVAVTKVSENGEATPVTDAEVQIRLSSDKLPEQSLALTASPVSGAAAGFYEVDDELPTDGVWQVEVSVRGSDGEGSVGFANTAQPPSPINWFLWAGGALALLALIVFVGTRRRKPRAATARGAMSSVVQE